MQKEDGQFNGNWDYVGAKFGRIVVSTASEKSGSHSPSLSRRTLTFRALGFSV